MLRFAGHLSQVWYYTRGRGQSVELPLGARQLNLESLMFFGMHRPGPRAIVSRSISFVYGSVCNVEKVRCATSGRMHWRRSATQSSLAQIS